jgi:transcriptional regulator with XRE-family HTH domain
VFPIGSSLRQARERQGLDLAEVERRTRVRARYLAALEEERFELLPGEAYARAFLRSYAEFLGLDSDLCLEEYRARFGQPEQHGFRAFERGSLERRASLSRRAAVGATIALFLLGVGSVAILALALNRSAKHQGLVPAGSRPKPSARSAQPRPMPSVQPAVVPVRLRAVAAFDPDGDHQEHNAEAPRATDGDPSSYWRTETYAAGLGKPGVGLLLDAGAPLRLVRLSLRTDTPGFTAVIEAGASVSGPFRAISVPERVGVTTTFALHGSAARYYLVWITRLDHVEHVNEVGAVEAPAVGRGRR